MQQWTITGLLDNDVVMISSFFIVKKISLALKLFYPVSCLLSVCFNLLEGVYIIFYGSKVIFGG